MANNGLALAFGGSATEICNNGINDDGDGYIDGYDSDLSQPLDVDKPQLGITMKYNADFERFEV